MHFLDTNIVLRLLNAAAPEHDSVRTAIGLLESKGEEFRIGLQVLVEAWVVATRPVERNGLGWSAEIAVAALEATRARFPVLHRCVRPRRPQFTSPAKGGLSTA